jgi:hypothetical protein
MSTTEGRKEGEEPMASDREPPPAGEPEPSAPEEGDEGEGVEIDEVDVRDLLRAALEPPPPRPKDDVVLLKGVQRRLRVRSKGKFYADGWSTSRSPRSTYLITSIFMLVLIAFVFFVLIPWSNSALP